MPQTRFVFQTMPTRTQLPYSKQCRASKGLCNKGNFSGTHARTGRGMGTVGIMVQMSFDESRPLCLRGQSEAMVFWNRMQVMLLYFYLFSSQRYMSK